ncbi:MAG: AI-2E family transporter [Acidobacteria bacterium]|jgi:predicted PurR-regulated permease PerM|nr:AI-2E family transporter [Acidobacteriota bacterium]
MSVRRFFGGLRAFSRDALPALGRWLLVQAQDALLVGVMWLVGLLVIDVPLAPLWALLATLFQFIPHFGTLLALPGPALAAAARQGWVGMGYVFLLYAGIVVIDGLVLQPLLMKRTAKVPLWASIVVPLVMGAAFNIWGLLLSPPLLAVFYGWRAKRKARGAGE